MVRLSRERTRQSAELERSNAELENFASIAAHDLQAPLRRIEALADPLRNEVATSASEPALDYLARIESSAALMRRMIDGLLELARVTTRGMQLERVDLGRLTRQVADELQAAMGIEKAHIRIGRFPPLRADPVQMRQLMQNLLGNALRYCKPGQAPDIRGHLSGSRKPDESADRVRFVVADQGIGFDSRYAERMFGVFERLEGPVAVDGTGIGLAICREIVQRHGGSIVAEGEVGQGARFIVTLPAERAPARPAPRGPRRA